MTSPFQRTLFLLCFYAILGGCGGSIDDGSAQPASSDGGWTDANIEADAGPCPLTGSYPIACGEVVLYCCPPGANCAAPSCGIVDAEASANDGG
jgi:hypothetical protein